MIIFLLPILRLSFIVLCVFLEGIDTWTRLHARMVVMLPKFNQSATACRNLFKTYKENKMTNGISRNARHESKFFDAMDEWRHQTGQVMKHVSDTTASHEENQSNSIPNEVESLTTTIPTPPSTSKGKGNFQEKAIRIFEKMAENSTNLMKCFERNNELLQNLDNQFDRLINKL